MEAIIGLVILIIAVVVLITLGIVFWDTTWGQILFWIGLVIGILVILATLIFVVLALKIIGEEESREREKESMIMQM